VRRDGRNGQKAEAAAFAWKAAAHGKEQRRSRDGPLLLSGERSSAGVVLIASLLPRERGTLWADAERALSRPAGYSAGDVAGEIRGGTGGPNPARRSRNEATPDSG